MADTQWQQDYIEQYKRTSGFGAVFGQAKPGGWYQLSTEHADGIPHNSRVRRSDVVAMTEALRNRPDFKV